MVSVCLFMVCFCCGGRGPRGGLLLYSAINVDNYVFATWQINIARDCAGLSFEVANYGSDNLRVSHNIFLSAFRRDAKNNFVGMVEF